MVEQAKVVVRATTVADEEFLLRVFAAARPQFARVPLPAAARDALLRQQFAAQRAHLAAWPGVDDRIIERDGEPVGRLAVARDATTVRVLDIAVLPDARGAGLATSLLRDLVDEAERTGRTLRLHVASDRPARRLYERLGLRVVATTPMDLEMAR